VAGAFLQAGLIDRILAYMAPILLGGPVTALDEIGVTSLAQAQRWRFDGMQRLGPDLRLSLVPG
jgi:diaminohydroxyphosphoribosylaminopyrimidine deaminase/5-amino-6-(5-phosphoribosylamino)uracil reductase